jgi:hypothetical protein
MMYKRLEPSQLIPSFVKRLLFAGGEARSFQALANDRPGCHAL